MKTKKIRLPRLLLMFVFSVLSTTIKAQQVFPIRQLLNSYVEAKMRQDDTTASLTRLNMVFKQMDLKQQQAFRDSIYSNFLVTQSCEKKEECIAYIELYKFFSSPEDSRLPKLYFEHGEIAATVLGDSILLKECINDLLICDMNKYPEVSDYLDRLNTYLTDFRNFVPMRKTIDGVWIAAGTRDTFEYFNYPSMILEILQQGDVIHLILKGSKVIYLYLMYSDYFKINKDINDAVIPQDIVDLGGDRLYMCWSNEKLKKVNQVTTGVISTGVGEMVGTMRSSIMAGAGSSFGGQLAGNIGGGMLSFGADLLLDAIFSPKKEIYILECELEKINDYELLAQIRFQEITVKPDGTINTKEEKKDFSLFKNVSDSEIPFLRKISQLSSKKNLEYNKLSMTKLVSQNEEQMLRAGLSIPNTEIHQRYKNTIVVLGIEGEPQNDGICITKIMKKTYADFSDLKKGDIILGIDGFEMKTMDDINEYVQSLPPFSTVTIKLKRGKNIMETKVETSRVIIDNM
ncbi:MAG: PDZ domain-containing protein [Bacteroidaceae bacterium]|nr:PDZ domain-containing protein [Bacteroidaceae bacterium]